MSARQGNTGLLAGIISSISAGAAFLGFDAELAPDMGELDRVGQPPIGHHCPQRRPPGVGEE